LGSAVGGAGRGDDFPLKTARQKAAGYNRRLCSISLAGWPCRVSQALQEYWGYFYPATQGLIMVVIRLSRGGSKHRPFFNIVVADKRVRRDGRFIERIGFYNPIAKGGEEGLRIVQDRLTHWIGVGAQASPTVLRLIKQGGASVAVSAAELPAEVAAA
jgi:small subunit ribosomal protein S16